MINIEERMNLDSLNDPNFGSALLTWSTISFSIFLIIVIGSITYYTATAPPVVIVDQKSSNRMTQLNEALSSILGPKWPYVLFLLMIVLMVILAMLYIGGKDNVMQITINNGKYVGISLVVIALLLIALVILLAIREYRKYKNRQETGNIPNYKPSMENEKKTQQILEITGLSLVILIAMIFTGWYFISKK